MFLFIQGQALLSPNVKGAGLDNKGVGFISKGAGLALRHVTLHSLTLTAVGVANAGLYTCLASNGEGDGLSNALNVDVMCECSECMQRGKNI